MDSTVFLKDLALVLLSAGLAAMVFHRLGLPKILGYILVGTLLGPNTPPFSLISDESSIQTLAELGVIFLMFSLGLDFNLRKFRRVGAPAGISAGLDVAVMLCVGFMLGRQLGLSTIESMFLAGMMCDSSTTILAKILQDLRKARDPFAAYTVGVTVVEDVLAVGVIAVLTGVAATGVVQAGLVADRLWMLLLFFIAVIMVGLLTVPRLLDYLDRLQDDEVLVVPLVGICFGVSLIASRLELSVPLGAVLVGAIASESKAIRRLAPLTDPLRHVFSAVFFVAIGLFLNPSLLVQHWWPVLAVTFVIISVKLAANILGALLTGQDFPTAMRIGAAMAQVGEFAFIIAALGISLEVTGQALYQVGVTAAILSIFINPFLFRYVDKLAVLVDNSPACSRWTEAFRFYHIWAERISRREQNTAVRAAIRRSIIVIVTNTLLCCAALILAGFLANTPQIRFPDLAIHPSIVSGVIWLIAMIICLPMLVASFRKLQAVGMILSELALPMTFGASWARTLRAFIANAVLLAGFFGMLVLVFALSSPWIASPTVLIILMIAIVLISLWRWPKLVIRYSQAQQAIEAMLKSDDASHVLAEPNDTRLDLKVESTMLPANSPVVGTNLASLLLRTKTGATIVGISRAGQTIVNPPPDEIFQTGDQVYLLGTPLQTQAARTLLKTAALSKS
jgi:monovalent cation:H+ antiporter-2, CPA2 family